MNKEDFYFEIPFVSQVAKDMYLRAANAPESEWVDYYAFKALEAKSDWVVDTWWEHLYRLHPFKAGIIKIDENTYYDWHIDTDRGVGLNMLLNNWDTSHCLFNPKIQRGESVEIDNMTDKYIELKYKPNTYYLFNTQMAHSVYNFKDTRYLLTIDFFEDRTKLNYQHLLKEIKQLIKRTNNDIKT